MVEFLLLISFLLHVVTFIIIKVLKDRIVQPDDMKTQMEKQQKEMEELLAVYLLEIREENDKFVDVMKNNQNIIKKEIHKETHDVTPSTREPENKVSPIVNTPSTSKQGNNYQPLTESSQQDIVEKSLAAQVLSLYAQGESIESIARKLDCGKTEIELMIKFHEKNN